MSFVVPATSVPPEVPRPWPPAIAESPRIETLRAAGPSALAPFWAEIERDGAPLVEKDGDATLITFLWRERQPVRDVLALVNKLTDRTDLARSRMRHMPGTDLWHLTYRVRDDWQATYLLAPDHGSGDLRQAVEHAAPDPLNPVTFPNERPPHRSVAAAPAATPEPRWWRPNPGTPAGTVDETTVDGRRVWRYRPPDHTVDGGPYPLLVLLDGDTWGPLLPVAPILDNLIAAGRIPPVVALLPDGADHPTRSTEYACHPGYADYLATLPKTAGRDLAPTTDPARTVIAGQSLGGLMAAYTAITHPNRFGNVLSQSGAFWWKSHTPGDAEAERLTHRIAVTERRPIRWHVEVGIDEWVTLRPNRHLRDVLLARGYPLTYAEFAGGHDRLCWRERLGEALTNLFLLRYA